MVLRGQGALWGALVILTVASEPCQAGLYLGSGTNSSANHALAASAEFSLSDSTLSIVLKNTSLQTYGANQTVPSSVLTALLVDINPTPNPFNLLTAYASELVNYSGPANPNLAVDGSKKDYTGTLGGWQLKPSEGLGTAGFGIFNGNIVNTGEGTGGFNFGLINAGYNPGDGNNAVDSTPLVRDTLTFAITVGSGFSLSHIQSVKFQYGTSLSEPSFYGTLQTPPDSDEEGSEGVNAVPEPSTLVMALGCVATIGLVRVIQRHRSLNAAA
ncbi:XDD4 family exosortase-dependent surface protein [Tautonia marina]|uniref:XDD4 family exosortase-dependent surface protein n=1 Tax=Tautonia marina TaxID=2653855 RepID=UPI0012613B0B|nr:XDD4 family exosortase-dependent surface protein [Tautonia marina]